MPMNAKKDKDIKLIKKLKDELKSDKWMMTQHYLILKLVLRRFEKAPEGTVEEEEGSGDGSAFENFAPPGAGGMMLILLKVQMKLTLKN